MSRFNLDAFIITNKQAHLHDGVGDYSYILANDLVQEGLKVKIICSFSEIDTFINHDLYTEPVINWNFSGLVSCYKQIRKYKPEYILFQYVPYAYHKSGVPVILVLYFLLFKFFNAKIHVNFHEIAIRTCKLNFLEIVKSWLQRTLAKILCWHANSVQTSNDSYRRLLSIKNVHIIPIPSNFEYLYRKEINTLRKTEPLQDITVTVNFNRCNTSFQSIFEQLTKQYSEINWKVKIIGRAENEELAIFLKSRFFSIYVDKINLHINESDENYLMLMASTDFYMQIEAVNSRGWGGISAKSGTCATALMLGLPIFTTKGDLTDENLFIDKQTVYFIPENDSITAASIIYDFLMSNTFRFNFPSPNISNFYKDKFSWLNTILTVKKIMHLA
jgi:hypothetical protein